MENNQSIIRLQEELETYNAKEDKYNISKCLKNIGIKYVKVESKTALKYFRQSLKIIKNIPTESKNDELKMKFLESEVLYDIGIIFLKTNKNKKALKYFKNASKICRITGNQVLAAGIVTAIHSLRTPDINYNPNVRENRIKNQFKYTWVLLLLSILPWLILILIFLVIF